MFCTVLSDKKCLNSKESWPGGSKDSSHDVESEFITQETEVKHYKNPNLGR